ncbi:MULTISPECIES: hypothetical protein [unclassified Leifsonia]|uniref:hypothetical protein n=1 Tax=unclassified Leifsonia TaxID=2663824 RepID=UPI000A6A3827|nr:MULTISPECIES: hypothetical protein [unclassified Leifsonia]
MMDERMPDSDEFETDIAGGDFAYVEEPPIDDLQDAPAFDLADDMDYEDDVDYEDENIVTGID